MIFSVLVTSSCLIAPTPGVCQFLLSNHVKSSGLMMLSFVGITVRTVLKERNLLVNLTRKGMQQQILYNWTNHLPF